MKEDVGMKTEVKSTEIIANSLNLISLSYKFCGKFKSKELSEKFIGILCASESILKFYLTSRFSCINKSLFWIPTKTLPCSSRLLERDRLLKSRPMNSESNTKFIFFNYVILFYLIEILDSSQLSFSSLPATASR